MRKVQLVKVTQLAEFDEVIDVRSPSEYALDHIPNAISAPVLNDEERARIGTLHKQVSPFDAKRAGAALVARNIATHLETLFHDKPRDWSPLVYCWRGGKRSGGMAHILAQIGWRVGQLDGGYKSYRAHVIEQLALLPAQFQFRVICGATGSGKSRLLETLHTQGAQVLDLEKLAKHRGSLLGHLPNEPQPPQKLFDTLLWDSLRHYNPAQPIFVEAESRKIGNLSLPETLIENIRRSPCFILETALSARIQLLKEDYAHFLTDKALLAKSLAPLHPLHGEKILQQWQALVAEEDWPTFLTDLLSRHYDPAYRRSTATNFPQLQHAPHLSLDSLDTQAFIDIANILMRG